MTTPENVVTFKEVNLSSEIRKIWGANFYAPVVEYRFSNGREFKRKTEDAAIYVTSPDF